MTLDHIALVVGVVLMTAGAPLAPTNLMKLVVTATGFWVAGAGARSLSTFTWNPIDAPLLGYLIALCIAVVLSKIQKPNMVFPSVMRSDGVLTQVFYVALALIATQLGSADREMVVRALVWGSAFVAIVAHWQSTGQAQWALPFGATVEHMDTRVRACGTLANPLFLGGYCALLLPIAALRASAGSIPDMVALGLLTYALVLSGARSGWAAGVLGMAVLLGLHPETWRAGAQVVAVAVVAAFGRGQHLSRASVAEVVKDSTRSTGSGRRYIWTKTWEQIRQRLWIGYGINAIAVANPDPHHRNPDGSPKDFFDTPHQALLHVMHAVGVLGAACYVAIWAMVLWHSGAWLPAFIAYAAWMMFSWGHLGPENAFWGLAGMAVAHP